MDGPADLRFGLPTSVGGLPFADNASAVAFALGQQAAFPTVPRLRSTASTLIHQVASFFPDAAVAPPEVLVLPAATPSAEAPRSAALDELRGPFAPVGLMATELDARLRGGDDELLGVRVGVLGPVTTALSLRSAGLPLEEALRCATAISATTAVAVHDVLRRAVGGRTVAVVLSEPGLIGSMHPTFPLLANQVHQALVAVVDALDAHEGAGRLLIGVHVPGRTDWPTLISTGVSLLSVPVIENLVGAAAELSGFLDAGGIVAWGAVPVDEPLGRTDELLWRRLGGLWCSLVGAGVDPFLLRAQSMISTSGGLAHFGIPQALNAFALLDSLSTRVSRQAAGTRLSLGA